MRATGVVQGCAAHKGQASKAQPHPLGLVVVVDVVAAPGHTGIPAAGATPAADDKAAQVTPANVEQSEKAATGEGAASANDMQTEKPAAAMPETVPAAEAEKVDAEKAPHSEKEQPKQ